MFPNARKSCHDLEDSRVPLEQPWWPCNPVGRWEGARVCLWGPVPVGTSKSPGVWETGRVGQKRSNEAPSNTALGRGKRLGQGSWKGKRELPPQSAPNASAYISLSLPVHSGPYLREQSFNHFLFPGLEALHYHDQPQRKSQVSNLKCERQSLQVVYWRRAGGERMCRHLHTPFRAFFFCSSSLSGGLGQSLLFRGLEGRTSQSKQMDDPWVRKPPRLISSCVLGL